MCVWGGGGGGEGGLVLVLFVHLFDLRSFGFVGFLFLLVSERGRVGGGGVTALGCGTPWTFLLSFLGCFHGLIEKFSRTTKLGL